MLGSTAADAHVNVGDSAARRVRGVLSSIGLGSCVALIVYDRASCVGALAHILLPHEALSRAKGKASKFSSTAVPHVLEEMRALAEIASPEARLVGGASMFASLLKGGGINMGERNVIATRRALVEAVLGDPRLAGIAALPRGPLLDVPDPRAVVLEAAATRVLAVRIHLTEPAA